MKRLLYCLLLGAALAACESVKPYQRAYLNDHEMQAGQPGARSMEENVQAYREGATGGGSTKNSGGCGCN
ncbi:DUF4266 domain-containing protein [Dawidia soli]|uniref:DUF4266 domain-containing protein n=1 Tax=Dawidia soli TaxID=2782352 RepID=A0AAP2DEH6_9BACT|nr:DUF4266 domain-containing protein [Dawidia soli]MBT1690706.1 DUF4266 domain-containing protein [Dawidia soli]